MASTTDQLDALAAKHRVTYVVSALLATAAVFFGLQALTTSTCTLDVNAVAATHHAVCK